MQKLNSVGREWLVACVVVVVGCFALGCGGGSAFQYFLGSPFVYLPTGSELPTGPGETGVSAGGQLDTTTGGAEDPCNESQNRKFVRISMRNLSEDYVHYFLILIAYVQSETHADGAVCPDDVQLYTRNGYVEVQEGRSVPLGHYCIEGPALYYYHRNGQFRGATGQAATGLASAIAPAQGAAPTYDSFFNSGGASMPVPNLILFHNPGTGEGAALKVSDSRTSPCDDETLETVDSDCRQDAFYYVDEDDRLVGSTALGFGSGRRVPDEIQGTACGCGLSNEPFMQLAASTLDGSDVSASTALCNRFLRGGRIEFIFVREDTDPPFPQLLWRVTDAGGTVAHQIDPRADID